MMTDPIICISTGCPNPCFGESYTTVDDITGEHEVMFLCSEHIEMAVEVLEGFEELFEVYDWERDGE